MTPRPVLTLRPSRALLVALEAEAGRRRMRVEHFVLEAAEVQLSAGRTRRRMTRRPLAPLTTIPTTTTSTTTSPAPPSITWAAARTTARP